MGDRVQRTPSKGEGDARASGSASLREALRDLPSKVATWRKEQGICGRCNGMRGIYVASNGGRTFVNCPHCKGSGAE